MADTDFLALASTNTLASTDQLLVVRGGVSYRFSGTLPALDASGNITFSETASVMAASTQAALRLMNGTAVSGTRNWAMVSNREEYGDLCFTQSNALGGDPKAYASSTTRFKIDANGNLLAGTGVGSCHTLVKAGAEGTIILNVINSAAFYNAGAAGFNSAATAMVLQKNSSTNRSINAAGTINASGADFAEYMAKADGCAHIAKGRVCGVNAAGLLTLAWSEAIAFMVKTTDPNLVGGDRWDRHVGPRPEAPAPLRGEPVEPKAPVAFDEPTPAAQEDEDTATFSLRIAVWNGRRIAAEQAHAEHAEALAAFAEDHEVWAAESEAFEAAQAAYDLALPEWEAAHEAARQRVDRIAYCGQVPVIVTGAFAPGDYLVAAEGDDNSIIAVAVAAADMTLPLYMTRLGKVLAVTEDDPDGRWPAGRAWVDVQHG